MRTPFLFAAIAALALTAACSRDDGQRAGDDLKNAGHSVDHAVADAAHSPDMKNAEADFRHAGHVAASDTRKAAAEAKVAAHKLAADTRDAAHGVTRRDSAGDKNS